MLNEFYFEIRHIKGKENKVVDALRWRTQVNHLERISWHAIDLEEIIQNIGQLNEKY